MNKQNKKEIHYDIQSIDEVELLDTSVLDLFKTKTEKYLAQKYIDNVIKKQP